MVHIILPPIFIVITFIAVVAVVIAVTSAVCPIVRFALSSPFLGVANIAVAVEISISFGRSVVASAGPISDGGRF